MITIEDFQNGVWTPVKPQYQQWAQHYLEELKRKNKFTLCIWPPHCLVGTAGHAVVDSLGSVFGEWEDKNEACISYTIKGNNALTEHYSALAAEVVREDDRNTGLNEKLLEALNAHRRVLVGGQALSHCVNYTVRDLWVNWKRDNKDIIILEDCCSSVPGFEAAGQQFLVDAKAAGCTIAKSVDYVLETLASPVKISTFAPKPASS